MQCVMVGLLYHMGSRTLKLRSSCDMSPSLSRLQESRGPLTNECCTPTGLDINYRFSSFYFLVLSLMLFPR